MKETQYMQRTARAAGVRRGTRPEAPGGSPAHTDPVRPRARREGSDRQWDFA